MINQRFKKGGRVTKNLFLAKSVQYSIVTVSAQYSKRQKSCTLIVV